MMDPPGAGQIAWLQKEGCVQAYVTLDERMTDRLLSLGSQMENGFTTQSGAPVIMARRVFVCL